MRFPHLLDYSQGGCVRADGSSALGDDFRDGGEETRRRHPLVETLRLHRAICDPCGHLMARAKMMDRALERMDAYIAATDKTHELTSSTRNAGHFSRFDLELFDP